MRFELTEDEWRIIEPLLQPVRQGGERRDVRQVLDGIFYVLRTGRTQRGSPATAAGSSRCAADTCR